MVRFLLGDKMEFAEYFKDYYLKPGVTRDDTVYENCSLESLSEISRYLHKKNGNAVAHVIEIDEEESRDIDKAIDQVSDSLHKRMLARDYIDARIMSSILEKNVPIDYYKLRDINNGIYNVRLLPDLPRRCKKPDTLFGKAT